MVFGEDHDYVKFPELSNVDLEAELLTSPHFQIVMDFEADVVKVVDGDTVTLQMEERSFSFPLRFRSVDAPELSTGAPGEEARSWLKTQVEGRKAQVVIDPKNRVEKWGRLLGDLVVDGVNMSEAMVHLGFAFPFERRREGELPDVNKELDVAQWF